MSRAARRHPQRHAAPGHLDILSVGRGHLRLTITPGDQAEIDKARRTIEDMLARGYAIFVETDTGTRRVKKFNPKRMTYLVDAPDEIPVPVPAPVPVDAGTCWCGRPARHRGAHKGGKRRTREVPVAGARATAVGRMAGG